MFAKLEKNITGDIVEFSTNFGAGVGSLKSTDLKIGDQTYMEIDIEEDIELGINAFISDEEDLSISHSDLENTIHAIIEQIDDDGVLCFRLAIDCIFMAMARPGQFNVGQYVTLKLTAEKLKLY